MRLQKKEDHVLFKMYEEPTSQQRNDEKKVYNFKNYNIYKKFSIYVVSAEIC